MSESGKNEAIFKKSYEISYALWRIAANIAEPSFADSIRGKAGALVGFSADGNLPAIGKLIPATELLIKFGVDVGAIGIGNGETIFYEIGNLKAAIQEAATAEGGSGKESGNTNEIYLGDIFAGEVDTERGYEGGNGNNQKAEIRQSAILERIRQIGNCRLADIQAILPGTSDRTIRYDLEALVQKGLVERLGTGGRSVYYRATQPGTGPVGQIGQ
jgi:hypothetical protein